MQDWVVSLLPMTWKSVEAYMEPNKPFELPPKCAYDKQYIFDFNGGTPRELKKCIQFLAKNDTNTMEEWRKKRAERLILESSKLVAKLTNEQKVSYKNFLSQFFATRDDVVKTPGPFYDAGLLYYDTKDKVYRPTCQPALDALLHFFKTDATQTLDDVLATTNPTEKGTKLEAWIFQTIGAQVELSPIRLGDPDAQTSLQLPGYVEFVQFDHTKPRSPSSVATLYKPRQQNFPAWDFILHLPSNTGNNSHRFIFGQVSTKTFKEHDVKSDTTKKKYSLTRRSLLSQQPGGNDHIGGIVRKTVELLTGCQCITSCDDGVPSHRPVPA